MCLGYDDAGQVNENIPVCVGARAIAVVACPAMVQGAGRWSIIGAGISIYQLAYERAAHEISRANRRERLGSNCWN